MTRRRALGTVGLMVCGWLIYDVGYYLGAAAEHPNSVWVQVGAQAVIGLAYLALLLWEAAR